MPPDARRQRNAPQGDRKSTRLNSSHTVISYAVFCLKKKKHELIDHRRAAAEAGLLVDAVREVRVGEQLTETFEGSADFYRRWEGLPVFFFNDTATTEIYTLSLHDALPI